MIGVLVALMLHPPLAPADVFDPAFEQRVARLTSGCAKPHAVVDQAWVEFIRRLPAESPGKQAYVGFLKDRYEYNIGRVNEAYGFDYSSFTDLTAFDFATVDRTRPAIHADDLEFMATIREIVDRVTAAALQRCAKSVRRIKSENHVMLIAEKCAQTRFWTSFVIALAPWRTTSAALPIPFRLRTR